MRDGYVVCDVDALAEGGRIITRLGGQISVGVFKIDGQVVAFRNYCPHAGAPACEGTLGGAVVSDGGHERHLAHDGRILKCPWHAWEFLLPEGVTITRPEYRLMRLPVAIEDGKVVVGSHPVRPPRPQVSA